MKEISILRSQQEILLEKVKSLHDGIGFLLPFPEKQINETNINIKDKQKKLL